LVLGLDAGKRMQVPLLTAPLLALWWK